MVLVVVLLGGVFRAFFYVAAACRAAVAPREHSSERRASGERSLQSQLVSAGGAARNRSSDVMVYLRAPVSA